MSVNPSKAGVSRSGKFVSLKEMYKFYVVNSYDDKRKKIILCNDDIGSLDEYKTYIEYNQTNDSYKYNNCKKVEVDPEAEAKEDIIGFDNPDNAEDIKYWDVSKFIEGPGVWTGSLYGKKKLTTKGGRSHRATFRQRKLKPKRRRRLSRRTRRTRR